MNTVNCSNCGAQNLSTSPFCFRCGHELPKTETPIIVKPSSQKVEPTKKRKPLGILIGSFGFLLAYVAVQLFFKPSFDKNMMKAASELNKSCPMMVDRETRLDNAIALPNNIFQYNYTLVNFDKSMLNADTIKNRLEPSLTNNVKSNPELKVYRDNHVTLAYNYRDKKGEFILKISITPEMYK
jgi:zinc-ribbon domain